MSVYHEAPTEVTTPSCHADRDGDCSWRSCPQLRDGEPRTTGRHCPLDVVRDDWGDPDPRQVSIRARYLAAHPLDGDS